MSEAKKTPIILKDIGSPNEIIGTVEPLLAKSDPQELIHIQLDPSKYPNRLNDMPMDVKKYIMTHPRVKAEWDKECLVGNEKHEQDFVNPCVTVCILTHNRTNVACATIDYLVKNLKYDNLKWCISDDRSTDKNHVEILVQRFLKNGINDVKVLRTNDEHYGLGASMNNALKYAWENGELALTMEDDWILQKELDLQYYVKVLCEDDNVALIRLCALNQNNQVERYNDRFDAICKSKKNNFIFNNQCGLRHKRIYDFLGYNKENCSSDEQECYIRNRYNKMTDFGHIYKVLFPIEIKKGTFDDPSLYFIHVGKSVSGHNWDNVPERYSWIYESEWLDLIKKEQENVFFRIIMPSYKSSQFIGRCLDSIKNQTFKGFKVVVVDDCSDDKEETEQICKQYDFVEYVQLDEHVDAGGCRNIGMKYFLSAKYTLFCDSDDYYMDNDAFLKLHDFIVEKNYPECVSFNFYWEQQKKVKVPYQMEAPWFRCIDTRICKMFKSHRRKNNDVIWNLRQMDVIKRNEHLDECLYCYTCDNPLSLSHNVKKFLTNNRVVASQFYLLADILEEKYETPEIKKQAAKIFKTIFNRIKNSYTLETLLDIVSTK